MILYDEYFHDKNVENIAWVRDFSKNSPSRIIANVRNKPSVFISKSNQHNNKNDSPRVLEDHSDDCHPNWRLWVIVGVEGISRKHRGKHQENACVPRNPEKLQKIKNSNSIHKSNSQNYSIGFSFVTLDCGTLIQWELQWSSFQCSCEWARNCQWNSHRLSHSFSSVDSGTLWVFKSLIKSK